MATRPVTVPPGHTLVRFSSRVEFDRWETLHPGGYTDALWEPSKRRITAAIKVDAWDTARRYGARPAKGYTPEGPVPVCPIRTE